MTSREPVVYGSFPEKCEPDVCQAVVDALHGEKGWFESLTPPHKKESMRVMSQITNAFRLFRFGMSVAETDPKLEDTDRQWLREASLDLENALERKLDLPAACRSVLARSYFLTGRFPDAANQYQRLIESDPSIEGYQSLALAHRRADRRRH
jgi:hypothetical protein